MTTRLSRITEGAQVTFPEFTGERVYMREFTKANGLPDDLCRWQPTIDAMLRGVETDDSIFIMIDQKRVECGAAHRRPGVHIDGWWDTSGMTHGHVPRHRPRGQFKEGIILASSVVGCVAYEGAFDGRVGPGGECDHVRLETMAQRVMRAGIAYAGDSLEMMHESIPLPATTERTVVRLNVRGWSPFGAQS